ncbi:MAG TPA: acyl-CoA dehydratase activase [Phycisphaerae bacterium]|nr:acyl-CoA dehydratase activase [Phycisphaerae bacterium]
MGCYVGIDIGAVSATAALLTDQPAAATDAEPDGFRRAPSDGSGRAIYLSEYRRTRGKPVAAATELLEQVIAAVGSESVRGVCLTGSGSKLAAAKLGAAVVNEFKAIAAGLGALGLDVRTVFEMGGETSKYLRLHRNDDGSYRIVDYATNGDCAAGTGSFIDQQAGRLRFPVEQVGEICLSADQAAQVAGRCSVFAKSDMIHAQQKGYSPAEVLRGLCNAVARNFRTAVVRSHPIAPPVVMLGGVSANAAVTLAMRETFELEPAQWIVPEAYAHVPAIGAAVVASQAAQAADLSRMAELRAASDTAAAPIPRQEPLTMDRVLLLRDRVRPYVPPPGDEKIDAYLGIDVGSVSTNLVAIDERGQVITEIYVRTRGRPIEVVSESLTQIQDEWGHRLNIRGVGTTGSGRELIGELVGADTVNDEITAHKTGATFVGRRLLGGQIPDTIFEIGGQDSKYISLQDGVVVDFTMNEACAAGTGSFLEERADELDIAIVDQFAEMALASKAPIRLGERCTVFMERDVNTHMQHGAAKGDLVAGLAYSVVYNYINRVVRGRKIGDVIFLQGGTAYNDSVAAAFASVLDKRIIVPPHNGVLGAIGAALLAQEKMAIAADRRDQQRSVAQIGSYVSEQLAGGADDEPAKAALPVGASRFRGYDMSKVDYQLREFTCRGCSNACQIQQFTVDGEKTYWGDKCSDRYRKRSKAARKPVIDDLCAMRMELLLDESRLPPPRAGAPTVGIPLAMFAWESLPFWRALLRHCGLRTVLSDPTNSAIANAGLHTVVAEPCFPIIVAHGHVADLLTKGVDRILLPNIVSHETRWMEQESYLCPWQQTLPFVVRRAPAFEPHYEKFLTPTVVFRQGLKVVRRDLMPMLRRLGASKAVVAAAVDEAYLAQARFISRIRAAGREAVEKLRRTGEPGIVLLGRPYNIHDAGVNLSVAGKLRQYYGVNCVPLDFLELDDIDISDTNDNMYWDLGRRILAGARFVGRHDNLHVIYITNFKCGPDSFIRHYIRLISGKPFLSLQFDGHGNDAGIMTRCEAYLDSKGILRPRRSEPVAQPAAAAV